MINDPFRLHGGDRDFERARAPVMEIPRRSKQKGFEGGRSPVLGFRQRKKIRARKRGASASSSSSSSSAFGDSTICAIVDQPVALINRD